MDRWLDTSIRDGHIQYIDPTSFSNVEAIARGAFGEVSRAYWNSAEKYVALKTLYTDPGSETNDSFKDFINEFQLIRHVDFHDNVVRFYGLSQDPVKKRYMMVLEYANGGNLREYLRNKHSTLDWPTKINMGKQIASGLKCIHKQRIVHRDLHSKNILVHDGKMMITDFGLSKNVMANSNSLVVGMAGYIEPRCFKDPNYKRNAKSDIYSLGVLLWEISSGRPPFNNMTIIDIAEQVSKGIRESPIPGTPIDYKNLYEIAWDDDPDRRPDIEEMRNRLDNIRLNPVWNPDENLINRFNNIQLDATTNDKATQPKQIQPLQQQQQQQYLPNPNPAISTVNSNNYRPPSYNTNFSVNSLSTPPDSNEFQKNQFVGTNIVMNQIPPNSGHYGPGNAPAQNMNYHPGGSGYQIPNQGGYPTYNQGGVGYPIPNQGGLPIPNQGAFPIQNQGVRPIQNQGVRPIQNQGIRPIQNPGGLPIQNPGGSQFQNPGFRPLQNPGVGPQNPGGPTQNPGGYPVRGYPSQNLGSRPIQNPGPQVSYPIQDPRIQQPYLRPSNPNYPQNNPLAPMFNPVSVPMPTPQTGNSMRPNPPYIPQLNHPQMPARPDQQNTGVPQPQQFAPSPQYSDPRNTQLSQRPPFQQTPQTPHFPMNPQENPQRFQVNPSVNPQNQHYFPANPQQNPQLYSQQNPQLYSQQNPQLYSQQNPQLYSPQNPQPSSQPSSQQNQQLQTPPQFQTPQVSDKYSSRRPCPEILAKYTDEYQSTSGYIAPQVCDAGYHAGFGDTIGIQFHLDNGGNVDTEYSFGNQQDSFLVLIASANCSGRELISILKCLKDYKADFSKCSKKTNKTALHRLHDNTALRKILSEKSGGARKYVKYICDAIAILTDNNYDKKCDVNVIDVEKRTVLSYFMSDQFSTIKPEEKKEIVSSLLDRGADPNIQCTVKSIFYTFEAPTALFMAVHYDWPIDVLNHIHKKDCDANKKDGKQRNVLCLAAAEKKPDYMNWLLENYADLSKPESLRLAKKHSGSILSKESLILRFFSEGKRKLASQNEAHQMVRDNTSSK